MKSPHYYIQDFELNIDPNLENIDFGRASLDFEVDDVPEYDEEMGALIFETSIGMDLRCFQTPTHSSRSDEGEVGTVDIELLILVEGEEDEFQEYISVWTDDGYRSVAWELRYHIESGIITEIFSPVAQLVDNSFRGILPGMAFTEPPSPEPEELPIERTEFLRSYLAENIKKEVVDYLRNASDIEFEEDSIEINISEEMNEIEINIPDELEDTYDNDEVEDIISSIFQRIVQQEAEGELKISTIDIFHDE